MNIRQFKITLYSDDCEPLVLGLMSEDEAQSFVEVVLKDDWDERSGGGLRSFFDMGTTMIEPNFRYTSVRFERAAFYPDGKEMVPGDTVTTPAWDFIGIVLSYDAHWVYVSWLKWDPRLEAPMKAHHQPSDLTLKARSN